MSRRGAKVSAYFKRLKKNSDLFNKIKDSMINAKQNLIPDLQSQRGINWYVVKNRIEFEGLVFQNAEGIEAEARERVMVSLLTHRDAEINDEIDWWNVYTFVLFPTHTEKQNRISAIRNLLKEI